MAVKYKELEKKRLDYMEQASIASEQKQKLQRVTARIAQGEGVELSKTINALTAQNTVNPSEDKAKKIQSLQDELELLSLDPLQVRDKLLTYHNLGHQAVKRAELIKIEMDALAIEMFKKF